MHTYVNTSFAIYVDITVWFETTLSESRRYFLFTVNTNV